MASGPQTVTILDTATASGAITLQQGYLYKFNPDSAFDGATLTVQVINSAGAWVNLGDGSGGTVTITVPLDGVSAIPEASSIAFGTVGMFRLNSSAAQSGADSVITITHRLSGE